MFHNDEIDEQKLIKRKRFLKDENVAEIKKFVGADLDMEVEFNSIDGSKAGKITFANLVKWALKKNMWIELEKQEEKKKNEEEDEEEESC